MSEERKVFAIKDEKGRYVGDNSFQFYKKERQWDFVSSEYISNGFDLCIEFNQAQAILDKLNDIAKQLHYFKIFNIEQLDLNEVSKKESKIKNRKRHPFVHECIKMGRATIVA
jgi:hypothetical protein